MLPESSTTQLWLTILGVYMPSAEYPQDTYTSYLEDVEHLISQLNTEGPLLIMGDLNAHLSSRYEEFANQDGNQRGSMWNSVISEHNFHNVSLGSFASGPSYTYSSGENFSTIDFAIANLDAVRGISSCGTLEYHPLNTSDHLLLSCFVEISHLRNEISPAFPTQPLDWKDGAKYFHTIKYCKCL